MSGERDLRTLLSAMAPERRPGRYVFTTATRLPEAASPVVLIHEPEGITLIMDQDQADRLGLPYEYVAAMITLRVHSSLAAVGLTAAVAGTLAGAGISCNVVAAYFHDHLFVPIDQADLAVHLLRGLAATAT